MCKGRRTVGLKGRRLGIKVSLYSYSGLNACQEFLSLIFYFHIFRVKFISRLAVSSLSCIVSGNWSLQVNSKWILDDNTSRRGPLSLTHCCKHWSLGWTHFLHPLLWRPWFHGGCRNIFNCLKLIILSLYRAIQILGVKTFFFEATTMELIHLVGVATRAITPCAARSSIASISLGLRATAMQHGVCCTGGMVPLSWISWSPWFIVVNQGRQLFHGCYICLEGKTWLWIQTAGKTASKHFSHFQSLENTYKNETAQIGAKTAQNGAKTEQIHGNHKKHFFFLQTTCFLPNGKRYY